MKNHGTKKLKMYIMINLEIQIQNSEMSKIQKPIGKRQNKLFSFPPFCITIHFRLILFGVTTLRHRHEEHKKCLCSTAVK